MATNNTKNGKPSCSDLIMDAVRRRDVYHAKERTKAANLIASLANVLNDMAAVLGSIRYQEWPVEGMGVGLTAERLDELLETEGVVMRKADNYIKGLVKITSE